MVGRRLITGPCLEEDAEGTSPKGSYTLWTSLTADSPGPAMGSVTQPWLIFFREKNTPYYEEEVLWEHVYYVEDYGFDSHPFLLFFTAYNGGVANE